MFKALKYLLFANLYKRAKKSFIYLASSIVAFIVMSFIMSDAISVASGVTVYFLLVAKWIILLILLGLIGLSILKIFNIATTPFGDKEKKDRPIKSTASDAKKEKILSETRQAEYGEIINKLGPKLNAFINKTK